MATITINGLNIADNTNYLVEELEYKGTPSRDIIEAPISTRAGDKLITTEWRTKEITIRGRVFSPTASGILPYIDALQQSFAVQSAPLVIDSGRQYTVSLESLQIPSQFYNIAMIEYTAKFLAIDPFAYGTQLTVSGSIPSGQTTFSGTVTISGSVFAQPTLTITPTNGTLMAGDSGYSKITATYLTTSEYITISGLNSGNFQYGVALGIDYNNFLTTISGTSSDYTGVFSRWEPGSRTFTISIVSGTPNGYRWALSYQPRYYE